MWRARVKIGRPLTLWWWAADDGLRFPWFDGYVIGLCLCSWWDQNLLLECGLWEKKGQNDFNLCGSEDLPMRMCLLLRTFSVRACCDGEVSPLLPEAGRHLGDFFTNESYNKGLDLQLSKMSASVPVWEVTVFFHRGFYFCKWKNDLSVQN